MVEDEAEYSYAYSSMFCPASYILQEANGCPFYEEIPATAVKELETGCLEDNSFPNSKQQFKNKKPNLGTKEKGEEKLESHKQKCSAVAQTQTDNNLLSSVQVSLLVRTVKKLLRVKLS